MTEETLIGKLKRNMQNGSNCPKVNPNPTALGHNSNIHMPSDDKVVESKKNYEMVSHPKHYNNYDVEVVDMMEKIWGTKATMEWCKMTAYKYRMRMGTKPAENETAEAMKSKLLEDFNKEQWYLRKADELKSKLFDKSIDMNQ